MTVGGETIHSAELTEGSGEKCNSSPVQGALTLGNEKPLTVYTISQPDLRGSRAAQGLRMVQSGCQWSGL